MTNKCYCTGLFVLSKVVFFYVCFIPCKHGQLQKYFWHFEAIVFLYNYMNDGFFSAVPSTQGSPVLVQYALIHMLAVLAMQHGWFVTSMFRMVQAWNLLLFYESSRWIVKCAKRQMHWDPKRIAYFGHKWGVVDTFIKFTVLV